MQSICSTTDEISGKGFHYEFGQMIVKIVGCMDEFKTSEIGQVTNMNRAAILPNRH
jgi:hypothetical protein